MDKKIKILFVDDEEVNTFVFKIAFSPKYEIVYADSGEAGLKLMESHPDIKFVISDLKMPGMDGLEFIREVKKLRKELPCLLLTGFNKTQEIEDQLNSKLIVAYQLKPFNKGEIEKLIEENT